MAKVGANEIPIENVMGSNIVDWSEWWVQAEVIIRRASELA